MGHAHAALRPIGPCGLAVQMPVFIVYGLVAKLSSKLTNSSESKRKRKRNPMRSGGISDEDALNRPFPFTLVVNNPNESDS